MLFIVTLFVIACKSSRPVTQLAEPDPGESAWRTVCSRCHGLGDANPRSYPAAEWPRIVQKMQDRKGGHQFTDEQKDIITKYLVAHAAN